ncbi:Ig-like domain-containing protein [Empedobacter tilapiae]|uniref:Ig-like domain-containing protein n=1 Tax=Empedobacter tilapiae TaxID=2491114 RepID=UPI0028D0102F|nr:Ig-like domain-containing protein [Empedobacter tilapiae]
MNKLLKLILLIVLSTKMNAQQIITTDIDNFWIAYDSVNKVKENKTSVFKQLYLDKGTIGLKDFVKYKDFNEKNYVTAFAKYPEFWKSIRKNTLVSSKQIQKTEKALKEFKKLYPNQSKGNIYYTIGALRSGGMPNGADLIVGLEKVVGDKTTNTSEFENKTLQNMFQFSNPSLLGFVSVHEFIHTFQKGSEVNVLAKAIKEGSADFIAELALKEKYNSHYLDYGFKNFDLVRNQFKNQLFSQNYENWFYNSETNEHPDLGYFVGYVISKNYYANSKNKKQAIKDLIELNYEDEKAVFEVLNQSKYYSEVLNIEELKANYEKNQPRVVKIIEFENGAQKVDTTLKQIQIVFSKPLNDKVSINFSKNGKAHFPLNKIVGLNADKTVLIVETIDLQPNTLYDFYITNRSTKSLDGYPFIEEEYKIEFKTKE